MLTKNLTFADRAEIVTPYGIPVMPLTPRTKDAFLKEWQNLATTDPDQIAKWEKKNPAYNCGAVGRKGGFWIFEVDDSTLYDRVKKETGHSLDELDTLVVKSSGAKRHYYFKHNSRSEAMGNFSADGKDGEIFSVRGHNAYVVSPGSIHPMTGQQYEVVTVPTFGEIPTAPDWFIKWLLASKPSSVASKTEKIPDIIPLHARNKTLTSLAGAMRRKGASKSAILAALRETNRQCQVPLPDSELATIAKSIAKYPPVKDEINEPPFKSNGQPKSSGAPPIAFAESGNSPPAKNGINESEIADARIKDMPKGVLDGWLALFSVTTTLGQYLANPSETLAVSRFDLGESITRFVAGICD
jgi:Bifunctional DNA primase/polymerase, N-terminal/Primase C terminal 1 (PriCT-1)